MSIKIARVTKAYKIKTTCVIVISRLLLSPLVWSKVITLSDFYCIYFQEVQANPRFISSNQVKKCTAVRYFFNNTFSLQKLKCVNICFNKFKSCMCKPTLTTIKNRQSTISSNTTRSPRNASPNVSDVEKVWKLENE